LSAGKAGQIDCHVDTGLPALARALLGTGMQARPAAAMSLSGRDLASRRSFNAPVSSKYPNRLIAAPSLTMNRRAGTRRDKPPFTERTTRSRKTFEYAIQTSKSIDPEAESTTYSPIGIPFAIQKIAKKL
jgi:hypothetical protein